MASAIASTALIVPVRAAPLIHVRRVETDPHGITVGELCEQFMHHKRTMVSIGELCKRTLEQYELASAVLLSEIGPMVCAEELKPDDFLKLRVFFSISRGPQALAKCIQAVRSIFKYGYDCGLIDRPMRFGPGSKRPAAKLFRRARHEGGVKMFEASELRAIIEAASPRVRPMILLGINCGLGNSDCGLLEFKNLNLEGGILDYPRPKTECDRRAFLWPETVAAIRRAITIRNAPLSPEFGDFVFLTARGRCWCNGNDASSVAQEFERTLKRAVVEHRHRGFYTLRRTFRTIADEVGDQPAAMLVMGHIPSANDMSSVYRQQISDERLRIVADYVRGWLYPSDKDNFQEAYQRKAKEVAKDWAEREHLRAQDVFHALSHLRMTQAELARYVGLNAQWISVLVCGRKPISSDTDLRLRAFIQELADGKHPEPINKKELRPQFARACDVPVPNDIRTALLHDPLEPKYFRVFVDYLMSLGITQRRLAFKQANSEWFCGNFVTRAVGVISAVVATAIGGEFQVVGWVM